MRKKEAKVSIVIPAYNEQNHIGACLRAIEKLEVKPYEVIVVDNMSSDETAKIAGEFPFVRLIRETTQGVVYARDRGFNEARGDIIGRIDADTLLPPDWTARLIDIFKDNSIAAVSGGLHFYDIGWSGLIDRVDAYWRAWMAKRMTPGGRVFLLGANMAVRKSAWLKVRERVCHQKGFHEDLDLALHLSEINKKVIFEPTLLANVSARRLDCSIGDITRYALVNPITYIRHHAKEHRYMYPIIAIVILTFWVIRALFRAFDTQAQHLSLRMLFLSQSSTRVNPAEFM